MLSLTSQPVRDDVAGLADAVGPVDGLVFDRRIPPGIVFVGIGDQRGQPNRENYFGVALTAESVRDSQDD